MIGIELRRAIPDLTLIAAREYALLINVTRGQTVRLLPALIIDQRQVLMIVEGVSGVSRIDAQKTVSPKMAIFGGRRTCRSQLVRETGNAVCQA